MREPTGRGLASVDLDLLIPLRIELQMPPSPDVNRAPTKSPERLQLRELVREYAVRSIQHEQLKATWETRVL